MKSRIFSSKYIKTISKGQIWIPAFIALGFLLAFPVTGMVKLSSWSDLKYSALQSQILYNNLWKDGFVLSGLIIASIAAFINSVNGFIYLYSGKKTDYYHGLPMKRSEMFLERIFSGLVYYLIPYIVTEFLMICIGAARGFFSLNIMGMAVRMLFLHLTESGLIYAAGVAGVTEILLVFSFSTGHDELVSVDNNDVIARVDVRCVFRLVFATESESDFSGKAADNLIGCINHVPFTLHFKRLGREGFHYYSPINLAHTNAPQIIFKLGRINSRDDIIYNGRAMTKGQRSNREDRIIRKKSSQFNLITRR